MLLGAFTIRLGYGLLVVSAPESTDPHDDWDAATQPVHAGPDSLYIGVQQAATGPVTVRCLAEEAPQPGREHLFSGRLSLPSARLQLVDPDETINMIVPVDGRDVTVDLYCDNPDEPAELDIHLAPAPASPA
ncbi:MAG: hypothetical protein ACJ73S_27160 [Mycobacteriales bacterium]|jgi:hypothetical protein